MSKSIYQLRIELYGSKPLIWREVVVPGDFTLGDLHYVVQDAMGWEEDHLHEFLDASKSPGKGKRRGRSRGIGALAYDSSTRRFGSHTDPIGRPLESDAEDEETVTLAEVCPKVKSKLYYIYDFGDNWEHVIKVQSIFEAKPGEFYPRCLAGDRACPLEDSGGIHGYQMILEEEANQDEPDDGFMPLEPEKFDIKTVNKYLKQLFGRR